MSARRTTPRRLRGAGGGVRRPGGGCMRVPEARPLPRIVFDHRSTKMSVDPGAADPSGRGGTPRHMLQELRVENLLLIDRAELRLAPGLNVVTGETGAGK